MPILVDIQSFANLNANASDVNAKILKFRPLVELVTPADSGKIPQSKSGSFTFVGQEAYNGAFKNLGNISGDVVFDFANDSSTISSFGILTGDSFITSFGENLVSGKTYVLFVKQDTTGNHSVKWPYGSSIAGTVGMNPNEITSVYVAKFSNKLFVKCAAFLDTTEAGEVIPEIARPTIYIPWEEDQVYRKFDWTIEHVKHYGTTLTDVSTDWEVATDPLFSNVVISSYGDPGKITIFPVEVQDIGTIYFRCRYNGVLDGEAQSSRWSSFSGEYGYFTDKTVVVRGNGGFPVTAVGGLPENVGVAVAGSTGGLFTIQADGSWTFSPNGEFGSLVGTQTTQVSYTQTENGIDVNKNINITVTSGSAPVFFAIHAYTFESGFIDTGIEPLNLTNSGLTNTAGYVVGNGYTQFAYCELNEHVNEYFTYSVWATRVVSHTYYQFLFGCQGISTTSDSGHGWFISLMGNCIAHRSSKILSIPEPTNVPFHVVLVFNSVLNAAKVYRNGEIIHEGPLAIGTIGTTYRNRFAIAGFSNFSSSYCAGARIHSVEIFRGEVSSDRIPGLYEKGII